MQTTRVGIREFRADLAQYIAVGTPVAVTRHGQTVGYFIPAHGEVEAHLAGMKKAGETLDRLLADQGTHVEDMVAEFRAARRALPRTSTRASPHKLPSELPRKGKAGARPA